MPVFRFNLDFDEKKVSKITQQSGSIRPTQELENWVKPVDPPLEKRREAAQDHDRCRNSQQHRHRHRIRFDAGLIQGRQHIRPLQHLQVVVKGDRTERHSQGNQRERNLPR